jgi:putative transposase
MEEHRKKRKSYDDEPGVHAFTFSCYRRRPFLNDPRIRELFLESVGRARAKHGFLVWAYVLMPEHVHLVVSTQGAKVRAMLKAMKQPTTQRTVFYLKHSDPGRLAWMISGMKRGNSPYSLWQGGGGFDRNLHSSREIWDMIHYVHWNPVRRGLVEKPEDWPWSSYRFYHEMPPFEFEVDRCQEWL